MATHDYKHFTVAVAIPPSAEREVEYLLISLKGNSLFSKILTVAAWP